MKNISFFIAITFFLHSCTVKTSYDFKLYITDTLITHQKFDEIEASRRMSEKLNLPIIFNGVDSFELRIWKSSIVTRRDLIILRYYQNQWVATKTEYYDSENIVDSAFTKRINLDKDVSEVVRYLTSDSILKLPSQYAIPNFVDNIADGQSFKLEISTKHFYKYLDYHCPEYFADREPNNRKFVEILNLVNKNFKFFYYPLCKM